MDFASKDPEKGQVGVAYTIPKLKTKEGKRISRLCISVHRGATCYNDCTILVLLKGMRKQIVWQNKTWAIKILK